MDETVEDQTFMLAYERTSKPSGCRAIRIDDFGMLCDEVEKYCSNELKQLDRAYEKKMIRRMIDMYGDPQEQDSFLASIRVSERNSRWF